MTFIRKTLILSMLLLLLLSCVSVAYGSPLTTTETTQSITIQTAQWNGLKAEFQALNSELIECQKELQLLKRPSAELLNELTTAQNLLAKLQQELAESKKELILLSSEVGELQTSLTKLKEQINKERKIHRRQVWQNRLWFLLIGCGIGYAAK